MVNTIKEDKTQSGENKAKETKLKDYLQKTAHAICQCRYLYARVLQTE